MKEDRLKALGERHNITQRDKTERATQLLVLSKIPRRTNDDIASFSFFKTKGNEGNAIL